VSELSPTFPKPLPQRSCFATSSRPSLSNPTSVSERVTESKSFEPSLQRFQAPHSGFVSSLSSSVIKSKSIFSQPLSQHSQSFASEAPFYSLAPATKSKHYSVFSMPLRHHIQQESLS